MVIPPRIEKHGRRYRFVHFINVKDEQFLATKLDNMVLDDRKLLANLPIFNRVKFAHSNDPDHKGDMKVGGFNMGGSNLGAGAQNVLRRNH